MSENMSAENLEAVNQEEITPVIDNSKPKKRKQRKWIKPVIIVGIIAALGVGVYFGLNAFGKKATASEYDAVIVDRGAITNKVSGSGTIEPVSKHEITSLAKGEVISADFEEGQIVNKGDLLYRIDTKDVENSIESSKLGVERAQLAYEQELDKTNETNRKLVISTPTAGVITNTYVKNGDNVQNNTKICDIVDSDNMLLKLPFISEQADMISPGQGAVVSLANSSGRIDGIVKKVYSGETISAEGVAVKTVEITVKNPGSIKKDDKATAIVGNIACNDLGTFEDNETRTLVAETAGKISGMSKETGDKLINGEVVARIVLDSQTDNIKSNQMSVKDANLKLQNQYDQLDNYNITAPITGTVIQKTTKAGETVGNSNEKTVMAIIADMSKIIFKINIDELDIDKIEVDQRVDITADALPNKNFSGYVEYKSIVGTASNGVTSYPVTIVVENPEGLIPGMNVNANIIVESKENALRVPVAAITRGNMAIVKGTAPEGVQGEGQGMMRTREQNGQPQQGAGIQRGAGSPQQGAPQGGQQGISQGSQQTETRRVVQGEVQGQMRIAGAMDLPPDSYITRVETGINDNDYIEISSGLKEGDTVYIKKQEVTGNTAQPQMQQNVRVGPMGGGAMPAGGGGAPVIINRQSGGAGGSR